MSEDFQIILRDLFKQTMFAKNGVDRLIFRVNHEARREVIDQCEQKGLIRRENNSYFIGLLGIAEIGDMPEAVAFLADADRIFLYLRGAYRKAPNSPVSVVELAGAISLEAEIVMHRLALMTECNQWWSGHSQFIDASTASVSPAEGILGNHTFRACIEQMRRLRAPHEHALSWQMPLQGIGLGDLLPVGTFPTKITSRDWAEKLPENLARLLAEVHTAIDHQLYTLASMGLRAIIDAVFLDKVGDAGTFREKMKALHGAGFIATHQLDTLAAAIDAGNASSHRGYTPQTQDIGIVQDIVEHLLQSVYVHPESAKALAQRTPKRNSAL